MSEPKSNSNSLKVIGAGPGRTGTNSLKKALEILYDQPCYHMTEIAFKYRDDVNKWMHLFRQAWKTPDEPLDRDVIFDIFEGYGTVIGHPACGLYKQLMEIYPEAKIILTIRDTDSWIKSVRETIRPRRNGKPSYIDELIQGLLMGRGFREMADESFLCLFRYNVDLENDESMVKAFKRHIERVKSEVPADRLLIYRISDGWKPLCKFLNLPIPAKPFPKGHDREEMKKRRQSFRRKFFILKYVIPVTMSVLIASIFTRLLI